MAKLTELLAEFEAEKTAFTEALKLVVDLDQRLRYGRPIVTKDGRQLTDLYCVLHAINNDDLEETSWA